MKVPISWLKDYVDITISVEELAERLTVAGLEVTSIDYIGIPQGDPPEGINMPPSAHLVWDREKLVLGAIREVRQHPEADRLVLADVDYGGESVEQCVTGAPNLFAYVGKGTLNPPLLAPFAHEGAEVIDGHANDGSRMILKERKLRGIPNRSMVCSEKELGISDSHEGILLLDYDAYGRFAPGTPLQDVLGDAVLDIDMLPNIARAYNIVGVAREAAALTGQTLRMPSLDVVAEGPAVGDAVRIEIREPELNPRFTAALLRGVTIKPSPGWMQLRLKLAGMRPINNIVDVTNYVMLELGEPLHAFDYDILVERADGKSPTIITRLPEPGEHLVTLDGVEHALDPYNILVADTAGALSLGGVMGGLESEVQDPHTSVVDTEALSEEQAERVEQAAQRPATTNVLLEAASWNFINIRRTMQSQKMSSEAGMRFSRGVHPSLAMAGLRRCIELMRQLSGGVVAQGFVDEYPAPPAEVTIDLPVEYVDRMIGFPLGKAEIVRILEGLAFTVVDQGDVLLVTAPDHRLDIGEGLTGRADLVEEIARIYGYDRIPNTLLGGALPDQRANVELEREEAVRDALVRGGLREVVNYRLTTPEREALLTPAGQPSNWPDAPYVTLANPISADKIVMRHTLLASLLDVAQANARHADRQMMFEISSVYLPQDGQLLPDEPRHLGILMMGKRGVPTWQGITQTGVMDFFDLKGVIEAMLVDLRVDGNVRFVPVEHNTFHPGRAAALYIGKREVGVFGEVHPLVREAFGFGLDLKLPILAAELALEPLTASIELLRNIKDVPTQPAVYQDIALVVDADTPASEVEMVIYDAGGEMLEDVRLFDVYVGDPIPAGKKSLAYALTYRLPDRTLTDKQVAKQHEKIVKAAQKRLHAELRT